MNTEIQALKGGVQQARNRNHFASRQNVTRLRNVKLYLIRNLTFLMSDGLNKLKSVQRRRLPSRRYPFTGSVCMCVRAFIESTLGKITPIYTV